MTPPEPSTELFPPSHGPSEAEQERVVGLLRERLVQGQLSLEEFLRRMELALTAQTLGDLEALVVDLPRRESRLVRLVLRAVGAVSTFKVQVRTAWHTPQLPALRLPQDGSGPVLVGRLPTNDVLLSHPSVSRVHAELRQENGRWLVRDLGSANGTQVNGTWVLSPTPVRAGDRITFGRVSFRAVAHHVSEQA